MQSGSTDYIETKNACKNHKNIVGWGGMSDEDYIGKTLMLLMAEYGIVSTSGPTWLSCLECKWLYKT